MADESPTSLARALAIMVALGSPEATDGDGLGVVRIARLIGREKSQVSRTLKALAEAGFVTRDKFRIGRALPAAGLGVKAAADHLSQSLVSAPAPDGPAPANDQRRIS